MGKDKLKVCYYTHAVDGVPYGACGKKAIAMGSYIEDITCPKCKGYARKDYAKSGTYRTTEHSQFRNRHTRDRRGA